MANKEAITSFCSFTEPNERLKITALNIKENAFRPTSVESKNANTPAYAAISDMKIGGLLFLFVVPIGFPVTPLPLRETAPPSVIAFEL